MRDPDIQLLLEDYAYRFAGSRPHFIVMPEGTMARGNLEVLEENMNLRALFYDPKNHHQELADSISNLRNMVEAERNSLSALQSW
jgi:hypothetical protein